MVDGFSNVYDNKARAESYDRLEFPGTYYLAYRDLPAIISKHVQGKKAIDFGCGTGRSTRSGFVPSPGAALSSSSRPATEASLTTTHGVSWSEC